MKQTIHLQQNGTMIAPSAEVPAKMLCKRRSNKYSGIGAIYVNQSSTTQSGGLFN